MIEIGIFNSALPLKLCIDWCKIWLVTNLFQVLHTSTVLSPALCRLVFDRWLSAVANHVYRPQPQRSPLTVLVALLLLLGGIELNPGPSALPSACHKAALIHDVIADNKLDILLLTETWSPSDAPDAAKLDVAPSGYTVVHRHRARPTSAVMAVLPSSTAALSGQHRSTSATTVSSSHSLWGSSVIVLRLSLSSASIGCRALSHHCLLTVVRLAESTHHARRACVVTMRRLNRYEVIEIRWLSGIENFVSEKMTLPRPRLTAHTRRVDRCSNGSQFSVASEFRICVSVSVSPTIRYHKTRGVPNSGFRLFGRIRKRIALPADHFDAAAAVLIFTTSVLLMSLYSLITAMPACCLAMTLPFIRLIVSQN